MKTIITNITQAAIFLAVLLATQTTRAFYDPNLQRWPNRDPIEEDGGLNLYVYVYNNTLMFHDAFGRKTCAQVCADAREDLNLHQGDRGGVVCNEFIPCPCVFQYPGSKVKVGDCPEIDSLVEKHEQGHISHGTKCDPYNSCPHRGARPTQHEADDDECRQRKEDIPDLEKLGKKSGPCGELARELAAEHRLYVNRNCKNKK